MIPLIPVPRILFRTAERRDKQGWSSRLNCCVESLDHRPEVKGSPICGQFGSTGWEYAESPRVVTDQCVPEFWGEGAEQNPIRGARYGALNMIHVEADVVLDVVVTVADGLDANAKSASHLMKREGISVERIDHPRLNGDSRSSLRASSPKWLPIERSAVRKPCLEQRLETVRC